MPPSPVRYTEAKEHTVRRQIRLPGSVESRASSVVAAEVPGMVIQQHAREGQTVRKGAPLFQLRTTDLDLRLKSSEAQLREAESRLKQAELNLERVRGLAESKVVSDQDLDNAVADHNAWQGRVESLNADILRIQLALKLCTIRAPFAGLIAAERTEVGQWIEIGGPVVELVALGELEVRVEVPERYFDSLNPGAPAVVTFESIPGFELNGKVTAIIPRADPQARTFPLKVTIGNREGRVGVGMLAQVSFPAGEAFRATVVPKDAVVTQGEDRFVWLLNGDDTVKMVSVRQGQGVGAWVVVEGEVPAGARVITRGNERLMPGARVQAELLEYKLP
ncbi:MAG TPA: efflux RND transporter periplasmic adaptor subunit [Candidatus Polarisedimenticolia bacterium]|nr:efflux RND transporter periplasmic adaptor subunit [Candidatus Polarisedimenticolia bacterium]